MPPRRIPRQKEPDFPSSFFVGGRVMGGLGGGRGVKAVLIETWPNQTH